MPRQLTDHFHLDEFRCSCCGRVIEHAALKLAQQLEQAQSTSGPMTIVSGYRCDQHNEHVGGKRNSQHLLGLAADVACTTDSARYSLLISLLSVGFKRIGIGKSIIHADIGTITPPIIWTYYDA